MRLVHPNCLERLDRQTTGSGWTRWTRSRYVCVLIIEIILVIIRLKKALLSFNPPSVTLATASAFVSGSSSSSIFGSWSLYSKHTLRLPKAEKDAETNGKL